MPTRLHAFRGGKGPALLMLHGWHRIELYLFKESAFYWFGHLVDTYNRLLMRAMRPERLTVARWRCLAVLAEEDGISLGELAFLHAANAFSARCATPAGTCSCRTARTRDRSGTARSRVARGR